MAVEESAGKHDQDDESCDSFDSDEDCDFVKLPIDTRFLIIIHDFLSSFGLCRANSFCYLDLIRSHMIAFLLSPTAFEDGVTKAVRSFVEKQVDQCVHCQLGITLKKIRAKTNQYSEHSNKFDVPHQKLTWPLGLQLLSYYKPKEIPAYDSYKGDSVSAEFGHFLRKLLDISPAKPALTLEQIDTYLIEEKPVKLLEFSDRVIQMKMGMNEDQENSAVICYLLADHEVKQHEYFKALEKYKQAISFLPCLFDAWAGMALSWISSVTSNLDDCDSEAKLNNIEAIISIVRSFQIAHALEPQNGKVLMEYASFGFEIYSLVKRCEKFGNIDESPIHPRKMVQKFVGGEFDADIKPDSKILLRNVQKLFLDANRCKDIDPPSDRWFCFYMLGKIGLKLDNGIVETIEHFSQALSLLFDHDAVFPGRTISSSNAPRHAVECFELFYRIHTDILKFLFVTHKTTDQDNAIDDEIDKITSILRGLYSKRFLTMHAFARFCNVEETEKRSDESQTNSLAPTENTEADISSSISKAKELAVICVHALAFCSTRFPEHFKSRYRLAHSFFYHPLLRDVQRCGMVLLGWPIANDSGPFAGIKLGSSLFDPRKIQNGSSGALMSGFWRSNHPDFDRRGTFFAHTEKLVQPFLQLFKLLKFSFFKRCVTLLLEFLHFSSENNPDIWKLLQVAHTQLARTAPSARRYLRESDQSKLALYFFTKRFIISF